MTEAMSEQTALVTKSIGDEVWLDRLVADDPVVRLADTFLINCQVTPTALPTTQLIHPNARVSTGGWLLGSLRNPQEDALRRSPVDDDPVPLGIADVERITCWPSDALPDAYMDWRLCVEVYLLVGKDVYLLMDEKAMPYRRLTDDELGRLWSGRTLPFVPLDEEAGTPTGVQAWLVAVPARLAALGGLRGARGSLIEVGRAIAGLARTEPESRVRWEWTTEFYDDAACEVLDVDGLERVPVAVGIQWEVEHDDAES